MIQLPKVAGVMISVIIPTLNEARLLPFTLEWIQQNSTPHEVLVVDAGSSDGTRALAESAGCRTIDSPARHRARQMNLGARHAKGTVLLFLHADTRIPPTALGKVESALDQPRVLGGGFARRFDSPSLFLRLTCWLAECRSRSAGWFLGDQGIFVRSSVFDILGGYRDMRLFEDLDFSRRLARLGRIVTLRPPVVTSARRFAKYGSLATTLSDFWLCLRYLSGADPDQLAAKRACNHMPLSDRTDLDTPV